MADQLIIQLEDDCHIEYDYETGLRAVCENIHDKLDPEFDKLTVQIVDEPLPKSGY